MHELHLAQDILRKIQEEIRTKELRAKISFVKIQLGQSRFTHLQELQELLTDISKGTSAEGARIEFEISPIKTACVDCGREFDPKGMRLDCEGCGSTNIQLVSGNELIVKEIR